MLNNNDIFFVVTWYFIPLLKEFEVPGSSDFVFMWVCEFHCIGFAVLIPWFCYFMVL